MAISVIEIQKQHLEKANEKIDQLAMNIMAEADLNGAVVAPDKSNAITDILRLLESVRYDGNNELLTQTIDTYEKAIRLIKEELESPEISSHTAEVKRALEDAKKYLEGQFAGSKCKNIKEIFDHTIERTESGERETEYNDAQIRQLTDAAKPREEEEEKREKPYINIINQTQKQREILKKYSEISNAIAKLQKQIADLDAKIANPNITPEDKAKKEAERKNLIEQRKAKFLEAKKDKSDTEFDVKSGEDDATYLTRVTRVLSIRLNDARTEVKNALTPLLGQQIEVVDPTTGKLEKMDVSNYLNDILDSAHPEKLDGLTSKIDIDRSLLLNAMKREDGHKELAEIHEKINEYESRNADIKNVKQAEQALVEYEEPSKNPFKRFGKWIAAKLGWGKGKAAKEARATVNSNSSRKVGPQQEEAILREIEKNMPAKKFRDKYTVAQKDMATAKTEHKLNKDMEEFYRRQNESKNAR